MFAVLTHSRLRGPRYFPAMLGATLEVRRDLRSAAGLLRATNVIAGPTEFLTLTVWTDRDAMYHFMNSGAHERVIQGRVAVSPINSSTEWAFNPNVTKYPSTREGE